MASQFSPVSSIPGGRPPGASIGRPVRSRVDQVDSGSGRFGYS